MPSEVEARNRPDSLTLSRIDKVYHMRGDPELSKLKNAAGFALGGEATGYFFDPADEIDACLRCPFPSCNDRDPRCPLVQLKRSKGRGGAHLSRKDSATRYKRRKADLLRAGSESQPQVDEVNF